MQLPHDLTLSEILTWIYVYMYNITKILKFLEKN